MKSKGYSKHSKQREDHGINAQSGTLRAAVFGVNDGLVSNLSLVMGIAGALFTFHYAVSDSDMPTEEYGKFAD